MQKILLKSQPDSRSKHGFLSIKSSQINNRVINEKHNIPSNNRVVNFAILMKEGNNN